MDSHRKEDLVDLDLNGSDSKPEVQTQLQIKKALALEELRRRYRRDNFGFKARQGGSKVVVLVLDGLRWDFLSSHPQLKEFMDSISADSKTVRLRAQLPSISYPNWATLLTSARPELTGVTSNQPFDKERQFDNIFSRAQKADLKRGVAGDPGWSSLVHDYLTPLQGDGSLYYVKEDPNEHTFRHRGTHNFDEASFKILDSVLDKQDTSEAYDLFWGYFQDIDARSHQHGPFSEKGMSAVANNTRYLQEIVKKINNDTILIITSDHGHVDAGGHGGTEESVMQIPFILYKKGSGLGKEIEQAGWQSVITPDPTNLEVAPTICALLGLPVPAHSEGVLLDIAIPLMDQKTLYWHYHYLFHQKQSFVQMFARTLGKSITPVTAKGDKLTDYRDGTLELIRSFDSLLTSAMTRDGFWNAQIALTNLIANIILFSVLLHYMSAANLMSICDCCQFHPSHRKQNRKAILVGTLFTFVHIIITLVITTVIISIARGYSYPSFSMYNSTNDTYIILAIEIFVTLLVRALLAFTLSEWVWGRCKRSPLSPIETYLAHYYTLYWVLLLSFFTLACQQFYYFYLPSISTFRWLTPEIWDFHFFIAQIGFLLVPVLFWSIISFFFCTNTSVGFDVWSQRHTPPKTIEKQNLLEDVDEESIEDARPVVVDVAKPSKKSSSSSSVSSSEDPGL